MTADNQCWAVSETGELLWSYQFAQERVAPLLTPDGRLYITRDIFLDAIDVGRSPAVGVWRSPRHDYRASANVGSQTPTILGSQSDGSILSLTNSRPDAESWVQASFDLAHWFPPDVRFDSLWLTNRGQVRFRMGTNQSQQFFRAIEN